MGYHSLCVDTQEILINKKQTKEIKMRKISIIVSILLILASNANAFIWKTPDYLNTYNFYSNTYAWNTLEISYE